MEAPIPVKAAGGVVYRTGGSGDTEVLLIYRRGLWDLPKGKLEPEETLRECAVREVAEEVGLHSAPKIIGPLVDTYHEYERGGDTYGKTTHWFAMQLASEQQNGFDPQTEEDIEKVEWVPLHEAKERVGFQNLTDVLADFERNVVQGS